jgi:hypothetical protein
MIYRNGELSKAMMDRQWPHQVALPAYRCLGHNYLTIRFFCEALSLYPGTHSLRRDDQDMVVFSFVEREQAKQFRDRFGGEFLDPATRPRRPETPARFSAEQRLRHRRSASIAMTDLRG